MIRYTEESSSEFELYLDSPEIRNLAKKVIDSLSVDCKSHLVVKFKGSHKDVEKIKKDLSRQGIKVIEVEIEH